MGVECGFCEVAGEGWVVSELRRFGVGILTESQKGTAKAATRQCIDFVGLFVLVPLKYS